MASMVFNPGLFRGGPARSQAVEGRTPEKASRMTAIFGAPAPVAPAPEEPASSVAPAQVAGEVVVRTSEANASVPDAARAAAMAEQARLAALAANCLRGDAASWEALVRSQQRRVYALCYRFTGSASEAEDLTQEVFLKLYRNLSSFDPGKASFGVWLTALARNLLVDNYRRTRMERATDSLDESLGSEDDGRTRLDSLEDTRPSQEKHVAGAELRSRVQAALAKITPELREAVILRDLEDMDYRDIAGVLGIPQGTVKSRISRGRAELARMLKGMEGQVM